MTDILEELFSVTLYYKGIPVNIFGIPRFNEYVYGSVKSATNRLRKQGYIIKKGNGWLPTYKGKKYLDNFSQDLKDFKSPFEENSPKNLLVMFDIPHDKRAYRDWLRRQLIKFDYKMIQKSVWVGPSPLPKDFLNCIKEIKIKDNIKTFKLAKGYKIN